MSFTWDNFSTTANDRGVEVTIPFEGENIPFRIKRRLTIDERQRANQAAIEISLDKHGKPTIARQDQAAFTKMIVLVGLKFWPFEYAEGDSVPINEKTISQLDGRLLDEIAARILGTAEVDQEALVPFEKRSDEGLSLVEAPDQN
jgi:hypothetical protein